MREQEKKKILTNRADIMLTASVSLHNGSLPYPFLL